MVRLVFDASPLMHFARAGRLDVLARLVADHECFVPNAVQDEIRAGITHHPELADVADQPWLRAVPVDSLDELRAFLRYADLIGSGERDIGEASVLAWAEVRQATAVLDDQAGKRAGRERGVKVHGTLWLIFEGYNKGLLDRLAAENLIQRLADAEAWFPCSAQRAFEWADEHDLLRRPAQPGPG